MATLKKLRIENFAQIEHADLEFGDLTVLIGAQGTGKSLALQWLKTALDGKQIVAALKEAGQFVENSTALIDLIFGVGMSASWGGSSKVVFDGKSISPSNISRRGSGNENAFFIPAHRSMLMSDGWASPFQKLTPDTPVVARIFSQNLFDRFSSRQAGELFPLDRVLKKSYREMIDAAVFHGGVVGVDQGRQHDKRLRLTHGNAKLPYMTWTAGQREFTPLLLGLYHLLPSRQIKKRQDISWVIIEEPEMGLHPQAISVFLMLVLDLLWRGYRVVLSTHSVHVLSAVWMLKSLQEMKAKWQLVCEGFNVEASRSLKPVAQAALRKTYRVHAMEYSANGRVSSKNISDLDPMADDESMSGWGGLTGFTSRFAEAVRLAAVEAE